MLIAADCNYRPEVSEVAIVALPSDKWGQKVSAIVVLTEHGRTAGKNGGAWSQLDMRRALKEKLANYKIPQVMKVIDTIPRNAMGKGKCYHRNCAICQC